MRLKLTLKRLNGSQDDILVEADASTTIEEVASTILRVDRRHSGVVRQPTLTASLPGQNKTTLLSSQALLGEAWIGSGADIQIIDKQRPIYELGEKPQIRAMVSVEKHDTGTDQEPEKYPLWEGTFFLGRSAACTIQLKDPLVSKQHLRFEVTSQSVDVVDCGSANGTKMDGEFITRIRVEREQRILVGDTWIMVDRVVPDGDQIEQQPGPIGFTRSPRVESRYNGEKFEAPEPPSETEPQPFPFMALVAPVLMGGGMYLMTQRLTSLMFVALTPIMMIGNFITQKSRDRRRRKRDIARFEERLSTLRTALSEQVELERTVRLAEAPETEMVYGEAMRRGPLMWTRRPEHWSFLNVRLGLGTMPSRDEIDTHSGRGSLLPDFQERLDEVVDGHRNIEGVPIVENLYDAGALGFAGSSDDVRSILDAVLVQLTGLHSPAELIITAMATPAWAGRLDWLTWMPHTSSPTSPVDGHHLSDSSSTAMKLIAQLEGIVTSRLRDARGGRRGAVNTTDAALERGAEVGSRGEASGTKSPVPAVVCVVCDGLDIDQARLVQLAEQGPDAGVYLLWVAESAAKLPAACRTFVSFTPEGPHVGLVRLGLWVTDAQLDSFPEDLSMSYGRRMAPVFDAGSLVEDSGDIPRSVALPTLLGQDLFEDPKAVVEQWLQNQSVIDRRGAAVPKRRTGTLRAAVGSSGVDPMYLDLRTQGPHALVGGTTGSGKSEFLQAWVLAMAAEYSPDRVTFLFVDYKGGSAFADCVKLPHCVGLVTDLSPHLVIRALTSLRAELHFREHLFQRKKAKDILELEKRGDPECPPALVIVIDEFAALVGEVPTFVDGVVDVAQRGRSLGIHLVMATQRPAGVIKDNLRANTNMRVALRMADESDSTDVVEVKDAAHFDPSIPGRGVVKTGPGRVAVFQSGYAGGWTTDEPELKRVDVYKLAFGGLDRWEEPEDPNTAAKRDRDLGPNDQQRLVACIEHAFVTLRLPSPRRPWLDSLSEVVQLPFHESSGVESLGPLAGAQTTDSKLLLGLADLPAEQAQRPVYFQPDTDGNMGVYGTGGSGKSVVLRTLATAAGITPHGGPVHVYGLDFASGGLRMLETLPHVGGIIKGEDVEKVVSILRTLRDELARRAESFSDLAAASIVDYRRLSGKTDLPRILLLVDGFSAFRDDFETGAGRTEWFEVFRDILTEGRALGIHVIFTADRSGAVPTYVRSLVQKNVLLRMTEDGFISFGAPRDVVTASSPPGRAIFEGQEVQIAVLGGTKDVARQAKLTAELGEAMARHGISSAPKVRVLPAQFSADELPDAVSGQPVLGLDAIQLAPFTFTPQGVMIVGGPPASGRTTALLAICQAMQRARPGSRFYLLAPGPSPLVDHVGWVETAIGAEATQALATSLLAMVKDEDAESGIVIIAESYNEFLQTPADKALVDLVKAVRNSNHLMVPEAETGAWSSTWPLMSEAKSSRRGLLLQPENMDGDIILKTALPRAAKGEFPPGRGEYIARGKHVRVQVPLIPVVPSAAA